MRFFMCFFMCAVQIEFGVEVVEELADAARVAMGPKVSVHLMFGLCSSCKHCLCL